jgi:4-aminobutyrate aminotransferase-like enzyme
MKFKQVSVEQAVFSPFEHFAIVPDILMLAKGIRRYALGCICCSQRSDGRY